MPLLRHLSVRGKLLAGFSATIFILMLLGVYSKVAFDATNNSFLTLNRNYQELRGFLSLEVSNKRLSDDVKSYLLTKDAKWEQDYNQTLSDLDKAVNELQSIDLTPSEVLALHTFEQVTSKLKGTELLILATAKEGNLSKATQLFDSKYDSAQVSIATILSSLVRSKNFEVTATVENSRQLLSQTQKIGLVLLILGILAAIIFAFYFANFITKAIRKLAALAEKLSLGDLSARSDISTKDEIEALGTSFNIMAENLEQTIRKLKLSEEQIGAERNKLQLVLSGITDAVIAVDLNREIVIFNKAAEKMIGVTAEQAYRKPVEEVLKVFSGKTEVGPREYCPIRTDAFEGVTYSQENLEIMGQGDKKVMVSIIAGQIKEGAAVNLGCIMTLRQR